MRVFNAVVRVFLTLFALFVAIIAPDFFSGILEVVASIVCATLGVLLLFYLWYPEGEAVDQAPERSNKR